MPNMQNQLQEFISTTQGIKNITFIHIKVHNLPLLSKSRRNQDALGREMLKEASPRVTSTKF